MKKMAFCIAILAVLAFATAGFSSTNNNSSGTTKTQPSVSVKDFQEK
jgi:hypothetical protein